MSCQSSPTASGSAAWRFLWVQHCDTCAHFRPLLARPKQVISRYRAGCGPVHVPPEPVTHGRKTVGYRCASTVAGRAEIEGAPDGIWPPPTAGWRGDGRRSQAGDEGGTGSRRPGARGGPGHRTLSRAIDARAFTVGRDIFFRAGAYAPGTTVGLALLGHELLGAELAQEVHGWPVMRDPAGLPSPSS